MPAPLTKYDRTVVGGVIIIRDKVLLVQRVDDDFKGGIFELPSGQVEEGEPIDIALRREILEETGLSVTSIGKEGASFQYRSKSGKHTIQRNFLVTDFNGRVRLSPEHSGYLWIPLADLDSDSRVDEQIRRIILSVT